VYYGIFISPICKLVFQQYCNLFSKEPWHMVGRRLRLDDN